MNTMSRKVLLLVIASMLALMPLSSVLAERETEKPLRADAPYSAEKSDPVTHEIDISIVVTPPYQCHVLKVWVPVPQSDAAQQVSGGRFSTFPMQVKPQINSEPIYGNRFAYFEFQDPKGAQIIRHRFKAKVWELQWNLDPNSVKDAEVWTKSFEPYLPPQALTDEKQFNTVLRQIVPKRNGAIRDLASIMHWIDGNLTYDHVNSSLTADANHAITQLRGHCSDYHGLCATMARALGYPTRVTYGLTLVPKNSPSHCKLEAFLPPYGWVSFDLSETQKMVKTILARNDLSDVKKSTLAAAARKRLLSGFRENSWLLLTKGTDYDLVPKASQPVRVVRTAYVEADGEPLPDPDPADIEKREFSWMTIHKYQADKEFKLPFKDLSTLTVD